MVRNLIYRWIKRDPVRYSLLHADMISARFGMTLEQYIWRSLKIAVLTGLVFALIAFFASAFLPLPVVNGKIGIVNVFNLQMPVIFDIIYPIEYILALLLVLSFCIGTYAGYSLLMKLPGIEKNNRSIKINLTLHNAVAYMYAMRKGGSEL
ncbi:MAG: secretion system protein, partial [Methanoregula sp.]